MGRGYSFKPDNYESLIGYIDFDSKGNITKGQLKKFIFDETYQQAEARMERQTRSVPPIADQYAPLLSENSLQKAVKALRALK